MNHHRRLATLIFCFFCLFIHPAEASHNNGQGRDDNPGEEQDEGGEGNDDAGYYVEIGDVGSDVEIGDVGSTSGATSGDSSATSGDSSATSGDSSATSGDVAGSVTNDLVIEAVDTQPTADAIVKAAKIKQKHSARAPRAQPGTSSPETKTPCGEGTGVSLQTGVAGGGAASILEACRAYRVKIQNELDPDSMRTTLVNVQYYVGFPFRLVLHMASGGILH